MVVESHCFGGLDVRFHPVAGECNEYNIIENGIFANPLCHFVAAHARKSDVDQGHVRVFTLDNSQARVAVRRLEYEVSLTLQMETQHLARIVLVFNDGDPAETIDVLGCGRPAHDSMLLKWNLDDKFAAA